MRSQIRWWGWVGVLGWFGSAWFFVEQVGNAETESGQTPPQVVYATPGYFFHDVIEVKSVSIEFSVPVVGVHATDLTVNDSLALSVMGRGAGPYVFTGFEAPAFGPVTIQLASGAIQRQGSDAFFQGYAWTVRYFNPRRDDDHDGLTNAVEIEAHADPTNPDTDHDGLPDAFELAHPCLEVFRDEAKPHEEYGVMVPGEADADHDGFSNLQEFHQGTDPCVADPKRAN